MLEPMTNSSGKTREQRALSWLWRAWASCPIAIAFGSLLIGYLRSPQAPELPATRDSFEALVALGFSGLVCLPLVLGACYLYRSSHATANARWALRSLACLLLALILPLGFVMFLTYLFGSLGIWIRTLMGAIFEPG